MFVLDTDVVPELRKVRSAKANPGVATWAEQLTSAELFVSAITIHELEHGVLLMERSDPTQGALLRTWLDRAVTAASSIGSWSSTSPWLAALLPCTYRIRLRSVMP